MKKTRINVHLANGTYLQCYVESWENFDTLKDQIMTRLGISADYKSVFGFIEVVERRRVYEERYIDEFFSCTEMLGFWNTYRKAKPDTKDFKLYFMLRANPKLNSDPALCEWQILQIMNEMRRGKIDPSAAEITKWAAYAMQGDLGDCPQKSGHLNRVTMNYVPITRKSEGGGESYWSKKIMEAYQGLAGNSREQCQEELVKMAQEFANFDSTLFSGRWHRCSDEDNHNSKIPEGEDCIFYVRHSVLLLASAEDGQVKDELDLSEISNWGCSADQFVYSTGESHSRVKEYFKCTSATHLCWLLNVYANQLVNQDPDFTSILLQKHIHLDKKKRFVSTFKKVQDL